MPRLRSDATGALATVKVGGGLNYVTGPMGAGKSLYGVRRIISHLIAGQYAVTNVELLPGWPERVAWHVCKTRGKAKRQRIAERLEAYYVYTDSLPEAMRYRLPGKGEARGVFIWDETHNDLNNRRWRDEGRDAILAWATQLRKLGFVGYLLSQHQDNTDAALRRVCNYQVRLQNQREQTRMLGLRVTPWPLFLACWFPTHVPLTASKVKPTKVERYFLGWHRHLYDTHGLDEDTGVEVVRLPIGGRGVAPEGAARPSANGDARALAPAVPLSGPAHVTALLRSPEPVSPVGPRSGAPEGLDSVGGGATLAGRELGSSFSVRVEGDS